MRTTFVALALAATALAKPMPAASSPPGCSDTKSGIFQISVVNATTSPKRDVGKRQLAGVLTLSLNGGVLKDQAGRTGYIASNYQFQFDNPPQHNAISTSGYSLCSNNSLALGSSAVFYQCYTGGFYNLYDRHWAAQCSPIYLVASTPSSGAPAASQISDGQPHASTAVHVSQISDGQPQASTAIRVSQISDGQPQAPTRAPVTQISDGQPQAPTHAPVTQISDGQPHAPAITSTTPPYRSSAPVTQISDGQPHAPVTTGTVPASRTGALSSSVPKFTGAAATPVYGIGALAAGVVGGVVMML
ncbi:hypothetical protein K504DRAFT_479872 [Pleomassaria siparia CBS 279.74]|uniref:Cell wall mannoprotein PIR1-like C-terminal domain-containing protein n=1 Tax=Pleomassaria siparia CBS 279.74 TaxID=1314801 RepID=A0A6G1KHU0_9PLEO|nr:hypothetical protein K504DRAFT_479872 [Pleomassaria siparia CBS 279.74]